MAPLSCVVDNPNILGDSLCDGSPYNTAACGYDGGDCCSQTCPCQGLWCLCGSNGYNCIDPRFSTTTTSTTPTISPIPTISPTTTSPTTPTALQCNAWDMDNIGNGMCDNGFGYNTEACGYDGGDCCVETCVSAQYSCGSAGYNCIDPMASLATPVPTPTLSPLSIDGYWSDWYAYDTNPWSPVSSYNISTVGRHHIKSICVWTGEVVEQIQVEFNNGVKSGLYGYSGSNTTYCYDISADGDPNAECFTSVTMEGIDYNVDGTSGITSLQFTTSTGITLNRLGRMNVSGTKIYRISGDSGNCITKIGVKFVELPKNMIAMRVYFRSERLTKSPTLITFMPTLQPSLTATYYPTCQTVEYAWQCFLGIGGYPAANGCMHMSNGFSGNGVFDLGEGVWDFPYDINVYQENIIIRGQGGVTVWNYIGKNPTWIQCATSKCWFGMQNLTVTSITNTNNMNQTQFYFGEGGTLHISNVIFDGKNYPQNIYGRPIW
eukprot:213473_1